MKNKNYNLSKSILFIALMMLINFDAFAQLANVRFSVRVGNVRSSGSACSEWGNEEYTAYAGFYDNVNTGLTQSGCLTCTTNGSCNYGGGTFLGTRTNNAYNLYYRIRAWEDDLGSRCSYNTSWWQNSDDCYVNGSPGYVSFRHSYPSNNSYTVGPQASYGNHALRLDWTWRYTGSASLLNPGCAAATTSYSGGAIRSWSVNMTAGRSYNFSTLGLSSEDTYIRIYSPNGYTIVASNDDANGTLQSNVTYTASSTGTYYVEVARFSRNPLNNSGSLRYQDVSTPAVNGGQIASSLTICSGGGISITSNSAASGGFGAGLSYQWQRSGNGSSWANISGATGATYSVSNLTNTMYFRRVALDCKNTPGYSNVVVATVVPDPTVHITSAAPAATICVGGTTLLTAVVTGGTGSFSYQWQYLSNGNWINACASCTNSTLNASPSVTRDYRVLVTNSSGCNAVATQTVTVVADPVITITGTNVTCNGLINGTATATITGGTNQNYQFNWYSDDGISTNNNPIGDGTLNIRDLGPNVWVIQTINQQWGCYATASITITEPSTLTSSATSGSIACNGGTTTVTVSAAGGTAPYTGTGNFTVGAGTHDFTVTDANGCTSISTITVTEPTLLTSGSSSGSIACNGGSTTVSVTASGGTAPYTGTGNFTVTAGTYNYTVTDANGCTSNTSITVSEPTLLTSSASSGSIACNGGTTTVTVIANGGTAPYNFSSFDAFINEIHYDNSSTDVGEAVEIAGTAGMDLSGWSICLYNGSNGTLYNTRNLSGILANTSNGFGFATENISGIQNGSPDGIALIDNQGNVVQFLSYEGSFTATNGPAAGMTSTDIGVSETGSTPAGFSLQLQGNGSSYDDFSWASPQANTFGAANTGQSFSGGGSQSSNVFTNVAAGTYEYTVTDANGCTSTSSITITEPPLLTASSASGNIACFGGSTDVTVSASGGTSPYMYTAINAFINEIHYDNASSDVGEAIEIAGTAGLDLTGWSICLYNGSNGTLYNTRNLSGVLANSNNGFGFATEYISGIQNGSPDAVALVNDQGDVVQFLSYEGSFTATDGPAVGMTSTNIGVSETSSTPVGYSLQLQGNGSSYNDFSWASAQANTFGAANTGQSFTAGGGAQSSNIFNNVTAGTHSYLVTDANGCMVSTTIVVTQPTLLTSNSTSGSILCFGGTTTVTVSATGGTAPYTGTGNYTVSAGTYSYTVTDANGCTSTTSITVSEPTLLTSSSTSGSILCFGGTTTVTVSAAGGTAPYTGTGNYTVSAGTHTYTVTDANGCTSTTSITVTEPPLLEAASTSGAILCFGGTTTVTVSATGGTAPYTGTGNYTVSAGTYSYTVTDANGCTSITNITVTEPPLLEAASTSGAILCFGGTTTVTVSATGGTAPYTGTGNYTVSAGTYSYTVTDANGCSSTTSITVTQPTLLTSSSTSGTILCYGGTTTVTVSGNGGTPPYSGTGNYTVTAGTYTYTVTDANGCTSTTSISIGQPPQLIAEAGNDQIVYYGYAPMACATLNGSSVGGTGTASYEWFDDNGQSVGNTASINVCPSTTTTYTVVATDANGCTASDDVTICVIDVVCYAGNSNNPKVEMCIIPPGNPGNAHTICVNPNAVASHLANGSTLGSCAESGACTTARTAQSNNSGKMKEAAGDVYDFDLFPNPSFNELNIRFNEIKYGNFRIEIIDLLGRVIRTELPNGAQLITLDVQDLQAGNYMLRVMDDQGDFMIKQFIKSK